MSELIRKEDALNALDDEITVTGKENAIIFTDYVRRVARKINDLPSVQPELANNSPKLDKEIGELANPTIAKKETVGDAISRQDAIDALDEIRHALWEIDIPSPTVPEYVEHHEQVQYVWKLLDKKQKELYALPSAQPERKRGEVDRL